MAKQASKLDAAPMEDSKAGRLQAISIAMQQIEKEDGRINEKS
jgi:hypothetical protein